MELGGCGPDPEVALASLPASEARENCGRSVDGVGKRGKFLGIVWSELLGQRSNAFGLVR